MNRKFMFYAADGTLLPTRRSAPPYATIKAPDGCFAIEGEYNHHSQRVNVEAMKEGDDPRDFIIDVEPQPPDEDHEWDATTKSFRMTAKAAAQFWKQREIEGIEAKSGTRALRELVLALADHVPLELPAIDEHGNTVVDKLRADEAQIIELRKDIVTKAVRPEVETKS
jgi:hypothetical protein